MKNSELQKILRDNVTELAQIDAALRCSLNRLGELKRETAQTKEDINELAARKEFLIEQTIFTIAHAIF